MLPRAETGKVAFGRGSAHLRVLTGGLEALLSVKEVASQLSVCAATVYRLCATGVLRHIRILNAVRVAPRDLRAFVADRAGSGDGS